MLFIYFIVLFQSYRILQIFFRDLSSDEEFVDELKSSIRFLASVILRRAKKVYRALHTNTKIIIILHCNMIEGYAYDGRSSLCVLKSH